MAHNQRGAYVMAVVDESMEEMVANEDLPDSTQLIEVTLGELRKFAETMAEAAVAELETIQNESAQAVFERIASAAERIADKLCG